MKFRLKNSLNTKRNMVKMADNIISFWNWFKENEDDLQPDKITSELINKLDEKILSFGDYNWEIREGSKKSNMLIISPGGNVDLLEETKNIINLSPNLNNWEFCHYKPAKVWDYQFSIEDKGVKRMINASNWEYVLLKFPNGTYDIIIKADSLNVLPKEYHLTSVDIVLESILGEELSLNLIKNIDLVDKFPDEYLNQKGSIQSLKEHIFELEQI